VKPGTRSRTGYGYCYGMISIRNARSRISDLARGRVNEEAVFLTITMPHYNLPLSWLFPVVKTPVLLLT